MDQPSTLPTVLIVEDDALVRGYMTVVWQALGWHVFEAPNADLALEMIDRHPAIDVAFTDIFMPGSMDGIGLARQLAQTHPQIQVILTSGIAEQPPEGLKFLRKPWGLRGLKPLLQELIAA